MSPQRSILLGFGLIVVSSTAFVVSCLFMAWKVSEYYRTQPPPEFLFKPINKRQFTLWDRPVSLIDGKTDSGGACLRIGYGDKLVELPVHRPKVSGFEDLTAYEEWLAATAFTKVNEGQVELDVSQSQAKDFRVVIIKRNAAPGHDDEMGGLVGRKLWTFDLVELRQDGEITQRRLQFPAIKYGTGREYLPALEEDPQANVEKIQERSWEFQAALLAIPKLHISNYRYRSTGVGAMGWTLPVAGFSMMGVVAGIVVWQGGRIGRRQASAAAPAGV